MALQTNQVIDPATGLVVTYNASTGGPHTVDCSGGRTFLAVTNASGASITVTLTTPGTDANGNAIADPTFAVAAGAVRLIPLNPAIYGAIATVAFSATTSVTFAALVLP